MKERKVRGGERVKRKKRRKVSVRTKEKKVKNESMRKREGVGK